MKFFTIERITSCKLCPCRDSDQHGEKFCLLAQGKPGRQEYTVYQTNKELLTGTCPKIIAKETVEQNYNQAYLDFLNR
jgi:hypothetical protein